jgi:enamine deaminase RidA (YjgF/YER057c/UK114 family)
MDMAELQPVEADIQPMFSADAMRYGDLLFVSGCVPLDHEGNLVGKGDLAAQMRKALENLGTVLAAAGTDFEHVIKTSVFLTDISKKPLTYDVRREFFGSRPPASTLVEVSGLDGEGLEVEIDAIAAMPEK